MLADLSPVGELEQVLAERIVVCGWRLRRLGEIETSVFQYGIFNHAVRRAEHDAQECTVSDYGDRSLIGRTVTDEQRREAALGGPGRRRNPEPGGELGGAQAAREPPLGGAASTA